MKHCTQFRTLYPVERCIQGFPDSCRRNRLINTNDCENLVFDREAKKITVAEKATFIERNDLNDVLVGDQARCTDGCKGRDHFLDCKSRFSIGRTHDYDEALLKPCSKP